MIILGLILLVCGYLIPIPALITIGWIVFLLGLLLWILGATGHAIAGRRHWF